MKTRLAGLGNYFERRNCFATLGRGDLKVAADIARFRYSAPAIIDSRRRRRRVLAAQVQQVAKIPETCSPSLDQSQPGAEAVGDHVAERFEFDLATFHLAG